MRVQRKAVSWLALAVLAACSCPTGAFRVCPGLAQFHTSVGVSAAPKLLKTPRAALVGTTKRCKIPVRQMRSSGMRITMGLSDWRKTCDKESGEAPLGCMPFPLDDLLLPGEQKRLHLYEARFLSLFEKAVKENGSCIGQLGFFEDGAIAAVAVLCEVVEWRRLDVGVHVRLRAVSRISVKALTQLDPFVLVSGAEYLDEGGGAKAAAGDTVARLVEKLYEAHSEIVDLSLKLDAAVPEQEGAGLASTETEIEWGHEKGNYRDCVRTPLKEQVAQYKQCLSEGRFLEEDGPGDDEFMWKLADAESEEVQLLSFVALAGMDPEVRLWALDQNSTVERIEKGLEILTERKNILAAKMALSSIKFD